jgi:pyruvate/2-oxoglutarate dehydrogenase complex dihydrolipoamide acyltransferase (E2) component
VKSKASGIVKKLLVEYGDRVKKGQLLAQLDKVEIEAGVEQSRAALQGAQANLKGAQADYERAKVDAESPDVPLLKRSYDRAVQMAKEDAVILVRIETSPEDIAGMGYAAKITNIGSTLWILGLKTEHNGTLVSTTGGGSPLTSPSGAASTPRGSTCSRKPPGP